MKGRKEKHIKPLKNMIINKLKGTVQKDSFKEEEEKKKHEISLDTRNYKRRNVEFKETCGRVQ